MYVSQRYRKAHHQLFTKNTHSREGEIIAPHTHTYTHIPSLFVFFFFFYVACTNCPLYTNSEQDDERAMRDAGIRAVQAAAVNNNAQVDLESILKRPPKPAH
jgi:hypothetical protein